MLTPCRARYRAFHAAHPWRCPKVAARHQRSVNVAISPPVRGHGCQTFLTETLTYHEPTVHKRMPVRDGPGGTRWSETTLREHKNGGPAWTRRLWRPVLYQLSYGPKPIADCGLMERDPNPQSAIANPQSTRVADGN